MIELSFKDRSAFPWGGPSDIVEYGLSKREYFAGLAMQSLVLDYEDPDPQFIAKKAVECADALLEELEKGEQNE